MKLNLGASSPSKHPDLQRVCLVNCRQDGTDETGLLRKMMLASSNRSCVEVTNPEQADLILITGILEKNTFESLRMNQIWQQYPEKSFGYSEVDNVPSFLHGVYASASKVKGLFNRMQSGGYPWIQQWRPNPSPLAMPAHKFVKKYLFSFVGRKSHPVRKRLYRAKWPTREVFVANITDEYNHWVDEGEKYRQIQTRYWQIMAESKFVICPRGQGASSIRLFEAMQAGVAPVVVSDGWIPAIGPEWKEFTLFIPERRVHKAYEILKSHESEFLERGKLAEAAYQKWFTPEAAWGQLLVAVDKIRESQKIPEHWFVRCRNLIYFAELAHEWRYRLPILIKTKLIR